MSESWQLHAAALFDQGHSARAVARGVNKPKSTVSDFLRGRGRIISLEDMVAKVKADLPQKVEGKVHLYIPDSQVRPGVSLEYLNWIGEYIVRKRPDVIIHAGDFADMESLSSYDKGRRTAEGKRVDADIQVAIQGMETLLDPLRRLQDEQRLNGDRVYSPRMVMTLGNHEHRINRHVDLNPELHGFLSTDSLKYKEMGWEVVPFLTPIVIDGVAYCHYFPNNMTGKPLGGSALNMLKTIGCSFTQGHKQTLDVVTRFLPTDGRQQWGIVAGACYSHDEEYKGVQGNRHWRGIIVKHNVHNGSYDPLFVSLDWLEREFGD